MRCCDASENCEVKCYRTTEITRLDDTKPAEAIAADGVSYNPVSLEVADFPHHIPLTGSQRLLYSTFPHDSGPEPYARVMTLEV